MADPAEEGRRLYFDLFKHLTTLSSGSILLLVTFKEKLSPPTKDVEWDKLMGIVFVLFIVCIISSVITMGLYAAAVTRPNARTIGGAGVTGVLVSTGSFVAAFVALIAFAMKNLY